MCSLLIGRAVGRATLSASVLSCWTTTNAAVFPSSISSPFIQHTAASHSLAASPSSPCSAFAGRLFSTSTPASGPSSPPRSSASSAASPAAASSSSGGSQLWMWGAGAPFFHNELQRSRQPRPVLFPSPSASSPIASISIADHHYAVVTRDGAVYTAGTNRYNELGHSGGGSQPLRRVPSLPPCVAVQCGKWQTVALTAAGEVFSWGWAGSFFSPNALGHGDKQPCPHPKRVEALQGSRVRGIAAGEEHVLALTEEGQVWAWGKGEFGRLGLGGSGNQLSPQRVDALTGSGLEVASVVCGSSFSAAVLRDGQLYTWGRNDHGQLGLGVSLSMDTYSMESVPSQVSFKDDEAVESREAVSVAGVAAGSRHMLALSSTGSIFIFGMRVWMKPEQVRGDYGTMRDRRIVTVGAGKGWSAAVDADGGLWTWGAEGSSCLGYDQAAKAVRGWLAGANESAPQRVAGFGERQEFGRAVRVIGVMDKIAVFTERLHDRDH